MAKLTVQLIEKKVKEASSLYDKISAWSQGNTGKSKMGYAAKTYESIFEALEKAMAAAYELTTTTMGKSYSDVANLSWDTNGMSNDTELGIWKMLFKRWGAFPIQHTKTKRWQIASFERLRNRTIRPNECPFTLTKSPNFPIPKQFKVGILADMKTLGVTYFNKMYNSRGIDKGEFTDSLINELISKGCINAEIIYPQLNNAGFVQVIGTTDISDNACIYLNNCIIASDWNKFNLKVEGSFGGKRHEISPSGTDFICAIQGFSYNINDSTMAKGDLLFGSSTYSKWVTQIADENGDGLVELVLPQVETVYVRFYIPRQYESVARGCSGWPSTCSDLIFKSYANIIAEHSSARAIPNGNAQAMLIASMQNFQYMYYNVTKEPSSTGINYVLGGSHCNFTFQGPDGEYKLAGGVQGSSIFSPLFRPNGNSHYYDCSSFTSLIVFNTGMFDPAKQPLALDSSLMQLAVKYWKPYLLPQYDIIEMPLTTASDVQRGDILYLTKVERGKDTGHAAIVWDTDGMGNIFTLEINGRYEKLPNQPICKRNFAGRNATYYKHIIRFVDKQ